LEVERVEKIGKGLKGEGRGERGEGRGEWGLESGEWRVELGLSWTGGAGTVDKAVGKGSWVIVTDGCLSHDNGDTRRTATHSSFRVTKSGCVN